MLIKRFSECPKVKDRNINRQLSSEARGLCMLAKKGNNKSYLQELKAAQTVFEDLVFSSCGNLSPFKQNK